ncbi:MULTISPECIES: hypothetical protein [Flavobacteriaceae]|uniref:Outer membrane protein beta-barrel domain-containing protein n=1 Tax=Mangrovimonas yunxiaonensis TaxID=1197477 RepID=A0A084TMW0_9FLAO|nr:MULTISPECIES: hypothetical protein [Flavobacteriaceae]KFB02046.1 hypothetical protein IA57_04070 [Mangrovimonas yunxiaonensis]UAB75577.1 hypothetical protein INR78_00905 [Mesoflavibacter sp. SCSIO 43206]UAB75581.1 hypothetical protein INR78_00925 [Mesoflavibacter sp. SCSIO 43206]GGH45523.1 hypothetical protein GCM10011364_19000 [Mangrovimonas yunxiaonensis]
MKTTIKSILTAILFIATFNSYAQKTGELIKLKTYNKVIKAEFLTESNDSLIKFLAPNIIYRINKINGDSIQLKALNFKKGSEKGNYYNDKIYYVSKSDFDQSYEEYIPDDKLSVGLLTLPFKARPQDDFSFDTEFNLSTTLNWNFAKIYNSKVNLQAGAGIGSVNLNSSNASGIEDGKAQDVATLNFFGGLMLEYKKVQAGFYVGVDQINNQSEYNWMHNGNLWFGFGIGFNVFKISLGEKDNQ